MSKQEVEALQSADAAEKARKEALKAKNKAELSRSMIGCGQVCLFLAFFMFVKSVGSQNIQLGTAALGTALTVSGLVGGVNDDVALILCFAGWFVGSTLYGTSNKFAVAAVGGQIQGDEHKGTAANCTLSIATMQLAVCTVYPLLLWAIGWNPIKLTGLQKPEPMKLPQLTGNDMLNTLPLALYSTTAHAFGVFCLAYSATFGQIVKSSEPVMSAAVNTVFYKKAPTVAKVVCIVFIVLGVAISTLKLNVDENDKPLENVGIFSGKYQIKPDMMCVIFGVLGSTMAAFKGGETKKLLEAPGLKDRFGGLSNQFAVTEILAFSISLPAMFVIEFGSQGLFWGMLFGSGSSPAAVKTTGKLFTAEKVQQMKISESYIGKEIFHKPQFGNGVVDKNMPWLGAPDVDYNAELRKHLFLSGMAFYLYNELATMTIKACGAVFSSVMNTFKRVIVLIVLCLFCGEEMTNEMMFGAAFAIFFVMLYSIIDDILVRFGCVKAAPAAAPAKKTDAKKTDDDFTSDEEEAEHKPLKGGSAGLV